MTEVCQLWVPRFLGQKIKDYRFKESSEYLKLMQLDWNLFVMCIVTGDRSWIYCYDNETMPQWGTCQLSRPLTFKVQASAMAIKSVCYVNYEKAFDRINWVKLC